MLTVAIPTLDAGPRFAELLSAVIGQQLDDDLEILVCDSGSRDDTVRLARAHGARVIEIPRAEFSHGATRNRLMGEATGDPVAFLTQDAVPASPHWLARLQTAFAGEPDAGLAFGPYEPRPDASPMVARELAAWFTSLAPSGTRRVDRLAGSERALPAADLFGPRAYFTDANGCVLRAAWEQVPFRDVAYAEDHLLALDMLRAGFAKVFVPGAAVVHSHDYTPTQWLRRSFDETRAVREVYGAAPIGDPRAALAHVRGSVGGDWRANGRRPDVLARSLAHHGARTLGALLGARAERLPSAVTARLSLENRR